MCTQYRFSHGKGLCNRAPAFKSIIVDCLKMIFNIGRFTHIKQTVGLRLLKSGYHLFADIQLIAISQTI